MISLKEKFSDADLQRIRTSVRNAEAGISGEIVPVMVSKSGYYTIANYKGCILGSGGTFVLLILADRFIPVLEGIDILFIFFIVVLVGVLGAILPNFSNNARRLLITQKHMDNATKQRAENAFLEQEVFNTRHRTGIMIFISFFENEVLVMADRGISKVVDQKAWDKIVRNLTEKIRKGKVVDGLDEAIHNCGKILLDHGFIKTPDDVNELGDDLRID